MTTVYVHYRDGLEAPAAGKNTDISGIIASMTRERQAVAEPDGQTVRA